MRNIISITAASFILLSCAEILPKPFVPSQGHLKPQAPVAEQDIPELVQQPQILPEPEAPKEVEKYTVVVNEVPVKELLFALARDAKVNVDIDPSIDGIVTINAIEQTLEQLLHRIARQVDLRYELRNDNLLISPDQPFFRAYTIEYLNVSRDTDASISTDTGVSGGEGGGGGANTSKTEVESILSNHFWANLVGNVSAMIGDEISGAGGGTSGELPISENVIPLPEAGVLNVKATSKQHELVQQLVDQATISANRQVLIQATIVEVTLNDKFQAGIDWSFVNQAGKAGFNFVSSTLAGAAPTGTTLSSFLLGYQDPNVSRDQVINGSLQLLEEFGDVSVLSSPQIMTLNNQTAILKVVDNIVYFEVDVEPGTVSLAGTGNPAISTDAKTVPVGIVMSLTPQINQNDSIVLQVRPTISRVLSFVNDPNPELANAGVSNPVPQLQVREMESILKMNNGQIAVLGGLMQDINRGNNSAIPGLSKIPGLGEAFKTRASDFEKVELVMFIQSTVIRNPSLDGDLKSFRNFLNTHSNGSRAPAAQE
jgi:general secretion pathway protein D